MFKYFRELFLEIKIWRKIRKIARASTEALEKDNFRVDWIGRIYTVINLPEEMLERTDLHEGYVLMQLKDYDKTLFDLGVSDYLFPEIQQVAPGAYLLILTGPKDYLGWGKFFWKLLQLLGLVIILKLLFSLTVSYSENIKTAWNSLIDLIW